MGEEVTYEVNDLNRAVKAVIQGLRVWESPKCDPRVKALILTKLEEAQLWSLLLVRGASE